MRKLLLLLAFVLIAASRAQAQATTDFHSVPTRPLAAISTAAAVSQPVLFSPQPTRRCCSLKGALIGAAIGAAGGIALSLLCDGSDCASDTIKAVAILGGIGAGIGMMTRRPSIQGPHVPAYGAVISVSF
jgi:hypothetical protein